ncbi:MAG: hypothetical protein KY448_18450, partial [Cyanobacteria bacterium 0813]|nr:hypothetical protein [Cyanobacteria bacterium 0813]
VSGPKLILSIDNAPDSFALDLGCQQCDDCLTIFVEHLTNFIAQNVTNTAADRTFVPWRSTFGIVAPHKQV